jgi:hypothetical protein
MRLTGNKRDIINNKVWGDIIYCKEKNILDSNWNIMFEQDMDIRSLINSNYLIFNIRNEINRE